MNGINLKIAIIVFLGVLVIVAVIVAIVINRRKKLMMQDERLKDAKLFAIFSTSVVISPDGFIGIASFLKTVIINIKDINGFSIIFGGASIGGLGFGSTGDRKVESDTGALLFKNIIAKVEQELKNTTKEVKLQLNMKDNTLVKIILLQGNSHYNKKGKVTIETVHNIPEKKQNEIKDFLSALENVEKKVKEQA